MTSTPKSPDDILGVEFDWLARDAADHVGLFQTAGGGYAPPEFLRDTDAHAAAIEVILSLPASTTVLGDIGFTPESGDSWQQVAERGLFTFDSDRNGGPYRLEYAPERPVTAAELPLFVGVVLADLQYLDLQFASLTTIPDDSLVRPPFVDRRFSYVVWFSDTSARRRDLSAAFMVVTHTAVRAKEWGDEVVRRYLTRHPELRVLGAGVTIAHAQLDWDHPSVAHGEDLPDEQMRVRTASRRPAAN